MTIERSDGRTEPSPFGAEVLDAGLASAGLLVAGAPIMFAKWARGFKAHVNKLPLFDQVGREWERHTPGG